jgi:hypothetical protein
VALQTAASAPHGIFLCYVELICSHHILKARCPSLPGQGYAYFYVFHYLIHVNTPRSREASNAGLFKVELTKHVDRFVGETIEELSQGLRQATYPRDPSLEWCHSYVIVRYWGSCYCIRLNSDLENVIEGRWPNMNAAHTCGTADIFAQSRPFSDYPFVRLCFIYNTLKRNQF